MDEWQSEQMAALGLSDEAIMDLIAEGHDWHAVKALLDAGCPRDTAVRILV